MQGPQEGGGEGQPIAELNVIPFIDICLVLLIIVLVTASFSTKLLGFDHPQAQENPTEYVEVANVVIVNLALDGKCTIGSNTVKVEELGGAVKDLKQGEDYPPFLLRASGKVSAQKIVAAMGQIRSAGEVSVSFALSE